MKRITNWNHDTTFVMNNKLANKQNHINTSEHTHNWSEYAKLIVVEHFHATETFVGLNRYIFVVSQSVTTELKSRAKTHLLSNSDTIWNQGFGLFTLIY